MCRPSQLRAAPDASVVQHAALRCQVREDLRASGSQLRGLVNNAGKVTLAPLETMPIEVFEDQLQVRSARLALHATAATHAAAAQ